MARHVEMTRIEPLSDIEGFVAVMPVTFCIMPDRIAAVGAVAASYGTLSCSEAAPPPCSSTATPISWCRSRTPAGSSISGRPWGGCSTEPVITTISDEVELRSFPGCDEGLDVEQ